MSTLRPSDFSVRVPSLPCGLAMAAISMAQAANRNNSANQRGRSLPRFNSAPRNRGATNAAHCLRRSRVTSTAATPSSGSRSSSKSQKGWASCMDFRAMAED
jgi:hypothetical protein